MGLRTALGIGGSAWHRRTAVRKQPMHETSSTCPLCGSHQFEDFKGRPKEKCHGCRSVGRQRLLISTLRRVGVLRGTGKAALHIAPEKAIAQHLFQAFGPGYLATDIDEARLRKHLPDTAARAPLDICDIDDNFARRRFDLIVHSHVLEHLFFNWAIALLQLQAMLTSRGFQVFSIPIFGEYTAENLDPNMPLTMRLKEFHQADHTRRFGATTFAHDMRNIAKLTGARYTEARSLFTTDELAAMGAHGHVFVLEAVGADGRFPEPRD